MEVGLDYQVHQKMKEVSTKGRMKSTCQLPQRSSASKNRLTLTV
jgi:hypothetical protein